MAAKKSHKPFDLNIDDSDTESESSSSDENSNDHDSPTPAALHQKLRALQAKIPISFASASSILRKRPVAPVVAALPHGLTPPPFFPPPPIPMKPVQKPTPQFEPRRDEVWLFAEERNDFDGEIQLETPVIDESEVEESIVVVPPVPQVVSAVPRTAPAPPTVAPVREAAAAASSSEPALMSSSALKEHLNSVISLLQMTNEHVERVSQRCDTLADLLQTIIENNPSLILPGSSSASSEQSLPQSTQRSREQVVPVESDPMVVDQHEELSVVVEQKEKKSKKAKLEKHEEESNPVVQSEEASEPPCDKEEKKRRKKENKDQKRKAEEEQRAQQQEPELAPQVPIASSRQKRRLMADASEPWWPM